VSDRIPVDVVDEEPVVDGGEVAAFHPLLDAQFVAGPPEAVLDVVGVAAPGGGGHAELEAVGEGPQELVELSVLADVMGFIDHHQRWAPSVQDCCERAVHGGAGESREALGLIVAGEDLGGDPFGQVAP